MYIEITDIKEIVNAQRQMKRLLDKEFPYRKRREIGFPSGYFTDDVRFASLTGGDVSWYFSKKSDDGNVHYNLFGRGDPNSNATLLIDLQFNLPLSKFSRTHGGAFVRSTINRQVLLAHRGIVTRLKSRVPKELLFQKVNVTPEQVSSDVSPGVATVLLVAPIDKPGLGTEIREFSVEIRQAATDVMLMDRTLLTAPGKKASDENSGSRLNATLSAYFDEFVGSTTSLRKRTLITRVWRHGAIVGELCKIYASKGQQYKSQAVDLVIETKREIWLFEVKTGSDSQSIYTAIGQLVFNGAALARKFPSKKVVHHLVLPIAPEANHRQQFCKELGFKLISFKDDRRNISFAGF
jgi:hypothetical protein